MCQLHKLLKIFDHPPKMWEAKGCTNPAGISVSNSHSGNRVLSQSFLAHGGNFSTVLSSLEEIRTIFTSNDVKYLNLQKSQRLRDHHVVPVPLLMRRMQHNLAHQKYFNSFRISCMSWKTISLRWVYRALNQM